MPVQTYRTVLQEVQSACRMLSIPVPTGVYDGADENARLMGEYANLAGEMVLMAPPQPWQQFRADWTITGDGVRKSFTVPEDYSSLVNNTGWSHATRRPVYLASAEQWAYIQAWVSQFTVNPVFRLRNNAFEFYTAPASGETITFEYGGKNWCTDADDPLKTKAFCDKNGDVPRFDWLLFTLALKIKWREAKGFDTAADVKDFTDRMSQVQQKDQPGQVLSISGGGGFPDPLISGANLPITGYGS